MDTGNILRILQEKYGYEKGMQVFMTVMPGIMADFRKMLAASPVGMPVMEEYKLEDGKAVITLSGRRLSNGAQEIDAQIR
mgnify:CR=1 FL=1